jgi:ribosomal protein S27E
MEPFVHCWDHEDRSGRWVRVACLCGAYLIIGAERAGGEVTCPQCGNTLSVPDAPEPDESQVPEPGEDGYIRYYCVCGKALKNRADLVGSWVRCPLCETVMRVPQFSTRRSSGDRTIGVVCYCGMRLRFAQWHAGQDFQCPECQKVIRIPDVKAGTVCDLSHEALPPVSLEKDDDDGQAD